MATFTYDDPDSPLPTRIETDRLVLDRFDHAGVDLRRFHDRLTSEGVRAAMAVDAYPNDPVETVADTRAKLDRYRDSADGFYAMSTDDEFLVGSGKFAPDWSTRSVEGGVWVDRDHWSGGYAAERARAFMELAFDELGLDCYYERTSARNDRARRAIEGYVVDAGGRLDGVLRHDSRYESPDTVEDVARYSITAGEWRG